MTYLFIFSERLQIMILWKLLNLETPLKIDAPIQVFENRKSIETSFLGNRVSKYELVKTLRLVPIHTIIFMNFD